MVKRTSAIKWGLSSILFQRQTVAGVALYVIACTTPLFDKSQSEVPSLFDAYGIGYLSIMFLLRFLILQLLPLYIMGAGISSAYEQNIYFRVRLLRSTEWQKVMETTLLGVSDLFCFLRLVCSSFFRETAGISMPIYKNPTFLCFFLSILETFASGLLLVNLYTRIKSMTGAFLMLFFLYFGVTLLPFRYYPFGLSAYSRVQMLSSTIDGSFRFAFIYLVVVVLLLHAWFCCGVKKYLRS